MGLESLGYRSARELFEAARDAARDAERKLAVLRAMEDGEGVRGAGGGIGSTGAFDPMARVDARIMREQAWAARIEDDYALVDAACEVLYGRGFAGGLDKLLGTSYADVLYFRYLAYEGWDEVAARVGYSVPHTRRLHDTALDYIDSNGFEETASGERAI